MKKRPSKSKPAKKPVKKNPNALRSKTGVTMLKPNRTVKHAMELLDDTFRHLRQKPPAMNTKKDDPWPAFSIEVNSLIAKWPEGVLKQFLGDLVVVEVPKDVSGMIGTVKRLLHEVFGVDDILDDNYPKYLARWRMWPHQRDRDEPAAKKEEDNLMANKLATNKKVASVKRSRLDDGEKAEKPAKAAKAAKPAKAAKSEGGSRSRIGDDATLKPGKAGPEKGIYGILLPLIPKGGITLAGLVKAAKVKKLDEAKARRYAAGAVREGFAKVA